MTIKINRYLLNKSPMNPIKIKISYIFRIALVCLSKYLANNTNLERQIKIIITSSNDSSLKREEVHTLPNLDTLKGKNKIKPLQSNIDRGITTRVIPLTLLKYSTTTKIPVKNNIKRRYTFQEGILTTK